jgi:tRNA(Ile)-lysidine synthetase-like protein
LTQINVLFIKGQIASLLDVETDPLTKKLITAFYEKTVNVLVLVSPPAICEYVADNNDPAPLIQKPMHHCFNSIDCSLLDQGIVLSFSGGVDSSLLLDEYTSAIKACVYINYGNRKSTSRKELAHVIETCKKYNKTLYVRHITELHRDHGNDLYNGYRSFYEETTRRIRFAAYAHVLRETNSTIIMLGHNHDDTVENMITNIRNHDHYDNLNGMRMYSEEYKINTFRPILHLTKDTIKTIAHKRGLVTLPNSTPEWSMRGMIRKELNNSQVFTETFTSGLSEIAQMLQNYYEIIEKYVEETQFAIIPSPKNKKTSGITITFAIPRALANNTAFITKMFYKITTANKIPNISKKAIADFMRRHHHNTHIILSSHLSWGPPVPNPGQGAPPPAPPMSKV